MFSGIIEEVASIRRVGLAERVGPLGQGNAEGRSIQLSVQIQAADLQLGESIAINGVCLTVARIEPEGALFFLSEETLGRSNLGRLKPGSSVNLERAMPVAGRFSGHIVQGHVDGQARFLGAKAQGIAPDESYVATFEIPSNLSRYIVEKGSITLDGISLTVFNLEDSAENTRFNVALIPHTWNNTHLSRLKAGDPVNVEVDVIAKYVERMALAKYAERMVLPSQERGSTP